MHKKIYKIFKITSLIGKVLLSSTYIYAADSDETTDIGGTGESLGSDIESSGSIDIGSEDGSDIKINKKEVTPPVNNIRPSVDLASPGHKITPKKTKNRYKNPESISDTREDVAVSVDDPEAIAKAKEEYIFKMRSEDVAAKLITIADSDGSGTISRKEMQNFQESLAKDMKDPRKKASLDSLVLTKSFDQIDTNQTNEINLNELLVSLGALENPEYDVNKYDPSLNNHSLGTDKTDDVK